MIIGVPKETFPGESRVALVPALVPGLVKKGAQVLIEAGAGQLSGFCDSAFADKGASVVDSRDDVFARADVVLQVRTSGANASRGGDDLGRYRSGQVIIGLADPLVENRFVVEMANRGCSLFSLELVPRITRAQSMDVLSSQSTIAGYKAVLLAAQNSARIFPMLITAAGTLTAAKAFVIGAGVAGLQAIATARRLGAIVSAYDVRTAVKEQIQSLGAKFVEIPLSSSDAEGQGGYAKAMDEDFYRRQREMLSKVVASSDIVVTTAAIPGKKSPVLVTADMVSQMQYGSVIVDLAAERGGNCELTKPDEVVKTSNGVTIFGPTDLPSTVPAHASQMYAKNISSFLDVVFVKDSGLTLNDSDEIVKGTLVCRGAEILLEQVRLANSGG